MIGNSPIDYAAIRLSITGLRVVAPASIGYLAICALKPAWCYLPLAVTAAAEAAFYLLVYLPRRRRLQAPSRQAPPRLTFLQRQALFDKCLVAESHGAPTNLPYPRGWFLPNGMSPRREDVIDWLLWAIFATSRNEINIEDYGEELAGYIQGVEKLLGKPLVPGWSDSKELRSMRITLDPVAMLHRPLIWYFIVALVDTYTSIFLTFLGFKHYTPRDPQWRRTFPPRPVLQLLSRYAPHGVVTPYWYRPHASNLERPVVFLHGIGIGLYPYIPFLRSLISTDTGVGVLLPEMMSICMHMTPRSVAPRAEMLASLNSILESLEHEEMSRHSNNQDPNADSPLLGEDNAATRTFGWNNVVLAAHSYGTFVAGWIIREQTSADPPPPEPSGLAAKVAHLVLVDPIPILLSNPSVAHNFLYRDPSTVCPRRLGSVSDVAEYDPSTSTLPQPLPLARTTKPWYSSPAAWQLWYFASRDADIAHTLFRSFFWSEGGIWREDIDAWITGSGGGSDAKGKNIAVVLSGMDQIVPSEAIRRYLTGDAQFSAHWTGTGTRRGITAGHIEDEREEELEVRGMVNGWSNSGSGYGSTQSSPSRSIDLPDSPHTVLKSGILEVLFNPALDHAVIFDDAKWTKPLVEIVLRYLKE